MGRLDVGDDQPAFGRAGRGRRQSQAERDRGPGAGGVNWTMRSPSIGYLSVDFTFTDRPTLTVYLSVLIQAAPDGAKISHYQVSSPPVTQRPPVAGLVREATPVPPPCAVTITVSDRTSTPPSPNTCRRH